MIEFVVVMTLSSWATMILLASIFPIFNFKDEFIDFWTKARGIPPARRRLLLNAYGAANYFFMVERCHDPHMPNAILLIPNAKMFRLLLLQGASLITAMLFWVIAFVIFIVLATYL